MPSSPATNRLYTETPADKRAMPAWAMSAGMHLAAFLGLALLVQAQPRSLPGEPDRAAGIVVVQELGDAQVEYFSEESTAESEPAEEGEQTPSDQAASAEAAVESSAASPLPPAKAAEALLASELDLPSLKEAISGGAGELVVTPNVSAAKRPSFNNPADDAAFIAAEKASRIKKAPSGPAAGVSLFGGPKAVGRSFVFVIDRSRSMGEEGLGALSAAQKELEKQLGLLEPTHTFEIIAYHHLPYYLGDRRLLPATGPSLAKVPAFFEALAAFGGTDHEMAILAALRLEPDVIFFLADGGDPYLNESQLARIKGRARGKTTISCVQFGFGESPEGNTFMQQLAAQNRGGYAYVSMRK